MLGLSGKSVELEYAIIYFSMPKRVGAMIRGGVIFGGNMPTLRGFMPISCHKWGAWYFTTSDKK